MERYNDIYVVIYNINVIAIALVLIVLLLKIRKKFKLGNVGSTCSYIRVIHRSFNATTGI